MSNEYNANLHILRGIDLVNGNLLVLREVNLVSELIAQRDNGEFEIISKSDATCWQMFLRIFNCGKLAGLTTNLSTITSTLSQYNLKALRNDNPAYLNACTLANKAYLSRYNAILLNAVGSPVEVTAEVSEFRTGIRADKYKIQVDLPWNPRINADIVRRYIMERLPKSVVTLRNKDLTVHRCGGFLTQGDLRKLVINVDRDLSPVVVRVPVPVRVPTEKQRYTYESKSVTYITR